MDFNVNPLSAVVAQIQGNNLCILDEMVLHDNGDTARCADQTRRERCNLPRSD